MRMTDANFPGKVVGLWTNDADIAPEIDEAVSRAKADTNLCGTISCVFLAEAAKIDLHTRASKVKMSVRERHLVEANEGQYSVD
jgi:hypothetical protein